MQHSHPIIDSSLAATNHNWTDSEGNCDGGISCGIGYAIAWQRGSLDANGRNGAFLLEVLQSCEHQLKYYQDSKFRCEENQWALEQLQGAIEWLEKRRYRRQAEGKFGTHEV